MNEPFELSANPWVSMLPQGAVGAPSGAGMLWKPDILAPANQIDPTAMQIAFDAWTSQVSLFAESVSRAFAEFGKILRRVWDNLTRAVRRALTIIKKSEIIKSKPHAHRKRINQRRLHVAQRDMANTDFLRYYDIVPERTHKDFQQSYHACMERVQGHLYEYADINLPMVDDGDDW